MDRFQGNHKKKVYKLASLKTEACIRKWGMKNLREADWMREFMVRKILGGHYPEDPIKADFFYGLTSILNQKKERNSNFNNSLTHLQYLIQKNR